MHNHEPQTSEASIKEGYEITDMNTRIIGVSLVGLFILMFGACAVIVMVIRGFNESRPSLNTDSASHLATPGVQVPQEPHLQGMDVVEQRKVIEAENLVKVATYGVVSAEPGMERVHIPVERAMALVADGKAPYRQAPTVAVETPTAESAPVATPAEAPAQP